MLCSFYSFCYLDMMVLVVLNWVLMVAGWWYMLFRLFIATVLGCFVLVFWVAGCGWWLTACLDVGVVVVL